MLIFDLIWIMDWGNLFLPLVFAVHHIWKDITSSSNVNAERHLSMILLMMNQWSKKRLFAYVWLYSTVHILNWCFFLLRLPSISNFFLISFRKVTTSINNLSNILSFYLSELSSAHKKGLLSWYLFSILPHNASFRRDEKKGHELLKFYFISIHISHHENNIVKPMWGW